MFLDDERSPAARLPAADRAWLRCQRLALLVPIFAGTGDVSQQTGAPTVTAGARLAHRLGAEALRGAVHAEDRKLLSGIAAQMSVALDLSRLRKRRRRFRPRRRR